jgi:hypothetical protein
MFSEFRRRFPRAALIGELVRIDHGKYIVSVRVESEGRILATGLAAADTVESAEDRARERAIAILDGIGEETPIPAIPSPEKVAEKLPVPEIPPVEKPAALAITTVIETLEIPEPEPLPIPPAPAKKTTKAAKASPPPAPEPPKIVPEPEPELEPFGFETEEDNYSLYPDNGFAAIEEKPEPEPIAPLVSLPDEEIDYSVLKTKIDVEMKRLGWTTEKGRDYLISTYGKKSRLLLTNEELLEFYNYLSSI